MIRWSAMTPTDIGMDVSHPMCDTVKRNELIAGATRPPFASRKFSALGCERYDFRVLSRYRTRHLQYKDCKLLIAKTRARSVVGTALVRPQRRPKSVLKCRTLQAPRAMQTSTLVISAIRSSRAMLTIHTYAMNAVGRSCRTFQKCRRSVVSAD